LIPSHGLSRTWNQRRVPSREKSQGQPLAGTLASDVLPGLGLNSPAVVPVSGSLLRSTRRDSRSARWSRRPTWAVRAWPSPRCGRPAGRSPRSGTGLSGQVPSNCSARSPVLPSFSWISPWSVPHYRWAAAGHDAMPLQNRLLRAAASAGHRRARTRPDRVFHGSAGTL